MISQMLAQPSHGLVSQLSRTHHVARQTLDRWEAAGRQALEKALGKPVLPQSQTPSVHTLVLTLLIETHASDRAMQSCLRTMHGIPLSLGSITGIVKDAGQRAQNWLERQQAMTPRTLALDEQDSSQRGRGSLNVIAVHKLLDGTLRGRPAFSGSGRSVRPLIVVLSSSSMCSWTLRLAFFSGETL